MGGSLADYVPFYFAPRSPMLLAIESGVVDGYAGGQKPVLHLVTSAEAAETSGIPFTFTDGHAEMRVSDFYDDLSLLPSVIDWGVMASKYWNDTPEYPDRKRKRQAEFLIHDFAPWNLITGIGVLDEAMKSSVEQALATVSHKPQVVVRRGWYY
jgi:hypothetical protein